MRAKLSFLPIFILFAAVAIALGAPADFAGEWTWNRSQSKDLPPLFSADKATLTIHMTTDMPTGPVKYDLVFKRK